MKNTSPRKIVFIGAGNVATFLSLALKGKADIIQVYSKTLASARELGEKIGCSFTNNLEKVSADADLYIIAVKDDAIADVSKKLKLPGKMVVHTSGSVNMDVLKSTSYKIGVIWPLYSFTNKMGSRFKSILKVKIPFFIEASEKKTEKELTDLVKAMGGEPYYLNSEKRAIVHLGAVFTNNFSNHLFAIAESLSKEAGVPFGVFLPIASETVENLSQLDHSGKAQSPVLNQTGPAIRNDKKILKKHIALLKGHPMYRDIYKILTKSIIKEHRGKKEL